MKVKLSPSDAKQSSGECKPAGPAASQPPAELVIDMSHCAEDTPIKCSCTHRDTLGVLCADLGCQLCRVTIITLLVCILCILFGFVFYSVVLRHFDL